MNVMATYSALAVACVLPRVQSLVKAKKQQLNKQSLILETL
jgi:hypothetical protein